MPPEIRKQMRMKSDATVGPKGEQLAADFLESLGYRVLDRNYRFERSEVDLVCFQPEPANGFGGEIVFVEVKTRSGTRFGRPEDAVTDEKKRNIVKASRAYLYEHKLDGSPCRFDVVSILLAGGPPRIEHFKNAFWVP